MLSPRVTVIVPTYNQAHFLKRAIDSVFSQTYKNWELIIINNFSTDNTIDIVKSYQDARVRFLNHDNCGVIASSRNVGIENSLAPYIAFLDSDDSWFPEKLQYCIDRLDQGFDLVCHSELWVGPRNRCRTVQYGPSSRATYRRLLLDGNCISTSAVTVRRNCLDQVGGFNTDPRFITAEDYDLWLRVAKSGFKIGFLKEVLGEYHIHGDNNSAAVSRNMNAVFAVYRHHRAISGEKIAGSDLRRREATIYYGGARTLQMNKQNKRAYIYLIKAIKCYPWFLRSYWALLVNAFLGAMPN